VSPHAPAAVLARLTKRSCRAVSIWDANTVHPGHILGAQVLAKGDVQVGFADQRNKRDWRACKLRRIKLHIMCQAFSVIRAAVTL
jgi:hypothetical protein